MLGTNIQLNMMLQSLFHVLQYTENWLDKSVSLEVLIAIPALFVALLVPIAFFLMERQDLYGFDKNIILDKIILAKISIPLVFLVSIALLFRLSTLSVSLTILLIYVVTVVLVRVYKWTASIEVLKYKRTYKQDMRLKFIRGVKNDVEKVDIWKIILTDENLLEKNQRGLVSEFISAVTSLHDSRNKYPKSKLLGLINGNISKIDFSDIQSYEDLVAFAIEYFQMMGDARIKNKQVDNKSGRVSYPSYSQRELALNLLKIALAKKINVIFDHIYFTVVKKYVAKSTVDEAGFARDFLPDYVKIVKENNEYDAKALWQELSDWVVTKELIVNEESSSQVISLLNAYMESIGREARVNTELSQHENQVIDDVTECLLPNVNVSFWFDILTFYNSSWGPAEGEDSTHGQIRSHVGRRRHFGLFNALGGDRDWIDDENERMKAYGEEANKQDEETIFILGLIYPWLRNPKEIQKIIDQIKIIEEEKLFETHSHEARRLESLKIRFEKIKDYNDKQIAVKVGQKELVSSLVETSD